MMGLLDIFFGDNSKKISNALSENGTIIDVRTPAEFNMGNIKGSINIPLDKISAKSKKIQSMRKPIVVCCASGSRSATAKMMIKSSGVEEVFNGGSWQKVQKLKSS